MFSKKYFRFSRNKSSRLYLISAKTTFFSSGQNILTFKLSFDDIQNCSRNIFYHCANIRSNTHESTHKRTFFFSGGTRTAIKTKVCAQAINFLLNGHTLRIYRVFADLNMSKSQIWNENQLKKCSAVWLLFLILPYLF